MTDAQHLELQATMRELIDALNRQSNLEAVQCEPIRPLATPPSSPDVTDSVALQYGHSAARWNEQMAQVAVDKTNQFNERQQDRWTLMFKQLKSATAE